MTILHGEQHVQSHAALFQLLQQAQTQNRLIERVNGKSLAPAELEQLLERQSLFDQPRTLVLEELLSAPISKKKDLLIAVLEKAASNSEATLEIILWEPKQLTIKQLSLWTKLAKIQNFKPTSVLFQWLDSLRFQPTSTQRASMLQLFHQAAEQEGVEFCWLMLQRQVRLWVEAKLGLASTLPPFAQQKIQRQSSAATPTAIYQLHEQLLSIDVASKTGASLWNLTQELELLLLKL